MGCAALAGALGLLTRLNRDLQEWVASLIWHFHFDPDTRYGSLLLC